MALDPAAYRLSDSENQRIFDARIKPQLFAGVQSSARPVAIIFGGQPGSGKSAALDLAADDLAQRGGAVQIIGDDLRVYHPDNARLMREDDKTAAFYTGPDSGRWVEKAIAYAKEQRFNILIEGTMRDSNVVAATMTGLRDAGYEIDARALAVAFRLSEQGIYQRYEKQKADRGQGRMTTPEAHQAAYDGLPITLARIESEKLADRVTIYRRGAVAIYENELRDGQWLREPQAAAVVQTERSRPLTPAEVHDRIYIGNRVDLPKEGVGLAPGDRVSFRATGLAERAQEPQNSRSSLTDGSQSVAIGQSRASALDRLIEFDQNARPIEQTFAREIAAEAQAVQAKASLKTLPAVETLHKIIKVRLETRERDAEPPTSSALGTRVFTGAVVALGRGPSDFTLSDAEARLAIERSEYRVKAVAEVAEGGPMAARIAQRRLERSKPLQAQQIAGIKAGREALRQSVRRERAQSNRELEAEKDIEIESENDLEPDTGR